MHRPHPTGCWGHEGAMFCGDTLVMFCQLICGLREFKSPFHKRYLFPFVEFLRIVPSPFYKTKIPFLQAEDEPDLN